MMFRAAGVAATLLLVGVTAMASAPAVAAPGDAHLAGLTYVALGDSYAAGFGLTPLTNLPVPGCAQSSSNYPHQVAAELGLALTDVTCSGATTDNVTTTAQVTTSGTAPIQDTALSASTKIVTLTIGGNDLGFADIMTYCAALGSAGPVLGDPTAPFTTSNCKATFDPTPPGIDLLAAKITGPVTTALNAVLADIATKAPNAKVFVVGYPALTPATVPSGPNGCFTSALGGGTPPFPMNSYPYTLTDVPYLHSVETLFDQTITTVANAHGATVVSLFADSSAHSPCAGAADAYVNGITVSSFSLAPPVNVTLEPGALHPNAAGALFQTQRLEAAIRAAFPPPPVVVPAGTGLANTGTDSAGWLALVGLGLLLVGAVTLGRARVAARR